ncbi:MAG: hypothetical protein RL060_1376 [Bacteroidota bacterium]
MHTIQLNINDAIYDKFLNFVEKFSKEEVEIISDVKNFKDNQQELQQELSAIIQGKATFFSQQELDKKASAIFSKYEDNIQR